MRGAPAFLETVQVDEVLFNDHDPLEELVDRPRCCAEENKTCDPVELSVHLVLAFALVKVREAFTNKCDDADDAEEELDAENDREIRNADASCKKHNFLP